MAVCKHGNDVQCTDHIVQIQKTEGVRVVFRHEFKMMEMSGLEATVVVTVKTIPVHEEKFLPTVCYP